MKKSGISIWAKNLLKLAGGGLLLVVLVVAWQMEEIGAALILHPWRRQTVVPIPSGCHEETFTGEGVKLSGWSGDAEGTRRGSVIYLHGVADSHVSGAGIMESFRKRGFDVVAYDSRAHGQSGGDSCTYGFHEKKDLQRVMDTLKPGPVVLIGSSLGAAVALQTAAVD